MRKNKITTISLNEKEQKLIDTYGRKYGLNRSACIRFILNDFFIKNKENLL